MFCFIFDMFQFESVVIPVPSLTSPAPLSPDSPPTLPKQPIKSSDITSNKSVLKRERSESGDSASSPTKSVTIDDTRREAKSEKKKGIFAKGKNMFKKFSKN